VEPPKIQPASTVALPARSAPVALTAAQLKLQQVYGLQKGEVFKLVRQPFIEERRMLYEPNGFTAANGFSRPSSLLLNFYDGKFNLQGMAMTDKSGQTSGGWTVKWLAEVAMNLDEQDIEGDAAILDTTQKGDIVYDPSIRGSSRMQRGLEQFLFQTLGQRVRLTFRNVERPVVVFRGTWHWNGNKGSKNVIEIYGASLGADPKWDLERAEYKNSARFAEALGTWVHESVFIDAIAAPTIIYSHENSIGDGSAAAKAHAHDLKLVCDHVAEQTGLTWTQETRSVRRLFIEKAN
jgi:hypothetical protein